MERGYPDLETARNMLAEAEERNPGPWGDHSRNVALAAKNIAECCPSLDPEKAYILGLLHDIGRRKGRTECGTLWTGAVTALNGEFKRPPGFA